MADTGWKSPTATGGKFNQWTNPTYAYDSDDQYASTYGINKHSWETFEFGVPVGATINGIEVTCECYASQAKPVGYEIYSTSAGAWSTGHGCYWGADEIERAVGSSSDLWGKTWIASDFSDANFSVSLDGQNAATTYYLDHIQVKVYYTEQKIGPFPTHFRI